MVTVRLVSGGGHTTQDGRLYAVGDVFEVTEGEADNWSAIFEIVTSQGAVLKTGKVNASSPVSEIDGIGPVTAKKLSAAGVKTIGDLATANIESLAKATGITAEQLSEWAGQAAAV